ncbi:Transcription initiation factor TFIID subunit 1 isoform C [Chlorella sorokiniana]|uniref:Transcription initiation factor TFIID subunit 1 n=1 Tax=Chlorella sorokiniana TaxID=3076 RepID=A0A2P6U5J7_CHLSO|nr:Transcription initiation factor TFIID subunit 1 isoform C [Chlorella sorokiniana]|eukprot:PRW61593.1 Transcription initiation factor TFIID subunit 1 isoform C [Chlorella sorokiniana]
MEEEREAPLVGFLFGNVDENQRVDADYLDEDAKEHLGGLARLQGGGLDLQEELRGDQEPADSSAAGASAAVQPAADAQDYADEAELIEDAEAAAAAAAAAAAEQQRQLGMVSAALQAGAAAEAEDYDFDEEEEPAAGAAPTAPTAAVAAPALPAAAAAPLPTKHAAALAPAPPLPAPPAGAAPQQQAACERRVRLPVLGKAYDGETVLRFSELYGSAGVMAGAVSKTEELRPPPLLARGRRQHMAAAATAAAEEDGAGDEEALLQNPDLEVPAEEEEEEEQQPEQQQQQPKQQQAEQPTAQQEQQPAASGAAGAAAGAAAAATTAGSSGQQAKAGKPAAAAGQQLARSRSRAGRRPASQQQAAEAAAAAAGQEEGSAAAGDSDAGAAVDANLVPVNTLPWEQRIRWAGAAGRDAAAESEHETDDEEPPAAAAAAVAGGEHAAAGIDGQPPAGAEQQWGQFGGGANDIAAAFAQQAQQLGAAPVRDDSSYAEQGGMPADQLPLADVIARFGEQQQAQQEAAQQQQWGQPAAAQQPWGALQPGAAAWQQQAAAEPPVQHLAAPLLGAEPVEDLPGLVSISAAEAEARAAAESDEEEYWALATAPLLRLEFLPEPAEEEERRRPMLPAPDMLLVHRERWEDRIAWDANQAAQKLRMEGPIFDLNDPGQAFELTRPIGEAAKHGPGAAAARAAEPKLVALVDRAAALILPPLAVAPPPPPRGSGFDPAQPEELELWQLQQGLAREREYHQVAKRKAGTVVGTKVLHAKLASDLATCPILNPNPLTQDEVLALAFWHTPHGKWWPVEVERVALKVGGAKKKGGAGPATVTVTIASLPGIKNSFQTVGLDTRLRDLWQHLVHNTPQFRAAEGETPLVLLPGRPPARLSLDAPLGATGAVRDGQKQVKLAVAFQDIELLPTRAIGAVPAGDNPALLRPPTAFPRKRDFSAAEPGHVVLLEYMEQQPPLLNRPGMGARLITYYRKKDGADTGHLELKKVSPRWRVGAVHPLGDDDESPFLGQLAKGSSSFSVESGLFRAPAHPYVPPHSDFLLLRSPAGTMQLRELAGTVTVGQELPMLRVPAPNAREVKDLEERRIYVHVFKHLRRQQAKLDKDPAKQGTRAEISLKALAEAFPSRPPLMIRGYLKDACDLAIRAVGEVEYFSLKPGARPPSEAELRKKLTPEEACALEACYVAAFRMKQRGLLLHEKLDKAAIEKLRLAAEMLPPDEASHKAARLIEQALLSSPWSLTDAFVAHFREGKAQLQLAGAADPTGRGFGYSFVRDIRHKGMGADDVTKQMAKRQAGKVQGTDADLRRMTTQQAKERLRKYGLTEEEITGLGRWTMIDMVRQLASAAAIDGTVDAGAAKWVRHQKTTLLELQRRASEKAQQVFDKQTSWLNDSVAEDLGDQDALEAELERELAAAEEGEEAAPAPTPATGKKKGKAGASPAQEDEQQVLAQMRAEGLMATPAGGAPLGAAAAAAAAAAPGTPLPAGSGGPPPKEGAGARRIRREVFLKAPNGAWQKSHEIVYVGRDRPGQLHSLYQKEGMGNYPFGFGARTVAGRPKELRLSYAAARGRGMGGRGARIGSGAGRGRGRGRGKAAAAADGISPEAARARPARQRKQRVIDDDFDEELSDEDLDMEWNEDMEAPYLAPAAQPKEPKQPRKKKAKKEPALEAAATQLPDDFAAALAAATFVREPSAPAGAAAAAAAADGGAPSAGLAGAASMGAPSMGAPSQGTISGFGPDASLGELPAEAQQAQQTQQLPPQDVQQPPAAAAVQPKPKPKVKIRVGGGAPAQPQPPPREPSPDYIQDLSFLGEEEEEEEEVPRRSKKRGKGDDEDYEAPDGEGSEDFNPEDEYISEGELAEERAFQRKSRPRQREPGFSRAPSRRSGGGGGGGGGSSRRGHDGKFVRGGGGGGSRGSGGRKRARDDYEEIEFEEEVEDEDEVDEAISDDDEEELSMASEEEEGEEEAAPKRGGAARAAAPAAGQVLGVVGRQLGAILHGIVHEIKNWKQPYQDATGKTKYDKTYDTVFGKPVSTRFIPDYHDWVPKHEVLILTDLSKKAKGGRYLSVDQFRAKGGRYLSVDQFREDLQRIYRNAVQYNTPGHGQHGGPYFIEVAKSMLDYSEQLIAQHWAEIQAAEAQAQQRVAPQHDILAMFQQPAQQQQQQPLPGCPPF